MGRAITEHEALEGLTEKQRRFVLAYRMHGNGTKAAGEAGYAGDDNALASAASRLLRNDKVLHALQTIGAPEEQSTILSTEELDEWCSQVVRGEVGEPETNLAGEVVGEAPPRLRDRIAAAKMLYQRRGAFISRSEVKASVSTADLTPEQVKADLRATLAELEEMGE